MFIRKQLFHEVELLVYVYFLVKLQIFAVILLGNRLIII